MALFHLLSFPDELQPSLNPPAQKYVRDSKARASTAMDVKEHPQSYVFVADMPGLKSADIKVHRCPTSLCHILKCCIHTKLRAGKQRRLRCAYPITVFRELCASWMSSNRCMPLAGPYSGAVGKWQCAHNHRKAKTWRGDHGPDVKYIRMERSAGNFMRKFTLPANADKEGISAACHDGVLTVTVPKIPRPEPPRPRTIEVTVG